MARYGCGIIGFRIIVAVGSSTFTFEAVLFVDGGDTCTAATSPVERRPFLAQSCHILYHNLFDVILLSYYWRKLIQDRINFLTRHWREALRRPGRRFSASCCFMTRPRDQAKMTNEDLTEGRSLYQPTTIIHIPYHI